MNYEIERRKPRDNGSATEKEREERGKERDDDEDRESMTLGRGEGGEAPATLLAKLRHRQLEHSRVCTE